MPQSLPDQITEIMERFRFKTVQRVMDLLGWCWDDKDVPPPLKDLQAHALILLGRAASLPGDGVVEQGGFRVEKRAGVLEMMFVVHGWKGD